MNPDSPCYKLLSIYISDSDIPLCVLGSLDKRFDDHLSHAENLSALFVALNDQLKTVWIMIRWFHQKPSDLDLQCFLIKD